jgi:hypothetical protein
MGETGERRFETQGAHSSGIVGLRGNDADRP